MTADDMNDHESAQPAPAPAAPAEMPRVAAALSPGAAQRLVDAWQDLKMNFAVHIAAFRPEPAWIERLEGHSERIRTLMAQDADAALYMLLQTATAEVEHYSAHHAMFCAVVSHLCSGWLDWEVEERKSLFAAALTMNIGMHALQDAMARQTSQPSKDQVKRIEEHPAASADMLASAGVKDECWLEVVRRHHDPSGGKPPEEPPPVPQRLAELLHRIDVFTAKLSRRQSRQGTSATVAARDACLNAQGHPDEIGATVLRILGLYPPGSCVRLLNGEMGVVIRRGAKAHTPIVAALRRADSSPFVRPARRDTSDKACGVQRAVLQSDLKLVINHERALAC